MANGQAELLRQVHQLFSAGRVGGLTDAELLARFISQRDEAAFAALVSRHGAMVLRICQGLLHDKHAAEDAFQATFLVLAHKARRLHVGESLGHWLHGVALRVAKKARSQNARRHQRELTIAVASAWEPSVDPDRSDTDAVLHEEVDRLPESYRSPIVLCYLQGLSYETAANQLGISEGTIRGRLARARDRLRIRLTRRGVVVPAGLLITENAWTSASAAVPNGLIDAAVQGALQTLAGKGTASASVMFLTKGVLRAMFLTKFKMATTSLLLVTGGLLALKPLLINPQANAAPASKGVTQLAGLTVPAPRPAGRDDGGAANNEPTSDVETNPKPWETAVRIKVHRSGGIGFGSGTVIQSTPESSLVLTCAHIFKIDGKPNPPPERYPHEVTVDFFDDEHSKSGGAQTFLCKVAAEVVDYDLARDVGLLRIRPERPLAVSPIVPPSWEPQKGMRMMTAGCSEGNPPTVWTTQITDPKAWLSSPTPAKRIGCRFALKPGRSGGGLFTSDGFLAGVGNGGLFTSDGFMADENFADPTYVTGYYANFDSIDPLLTRNGLAVQHAGEEPSKKETGRKSPEPSRPAPALVGGEVDLDPLIRITEDHLRKGDHQGARATLDQLDKKLPGQQMRLRTKLGHLEGLARRSHQLRRAADKYEPSGRGRSSERSDVDSRQPTPTPAEPDNTSPSASPDHERRLRDIERKLDRLLGEKERTGQGVE